MIRGSGRRDGRSTSRHTGRADDKGPLRVLVWRAARGRRLFPLAFVRRRPPLIGKHEGRPGGRGEVF
ncbi:hypothetical protein AvCA_46330 [Azotobacter vinelandii CA]|uniref:Uncharacterized protein n=2 Tax=Azotobacter vinelandii TaxID=354 RepID=C1DI06_AZOVD|nr:hypothetical protein Avin_46330 [Azotobacter vinelandii DJ]AGK14299.1 hypothetical protein AvCA_46330 [Azotobacter vinelandii CA]AGK22117.1 hypothetical protein AvCA6_46330 [Azotobacter vinelandii CA6]